MSARITVKVEFTDEEFAALMSSLPNGVDVKTHVHQVIMDWLATKGYSVAQDEPTT